MANCGHWQRNLDSELIVAFQITGLRTQRNLLSYDSIMGTFDSYLRYWLGPYFLFDYLVLSPESHDNDHVTNKNRKSIWFFGTIQWLTCLFAKHQDRHRNERAAISDISIMYIEINDSASRKSVLSSCRSKMSASAPNKDKVCEK